MLRDSACPFDKLRTSGSKALHFLMFAVFPRFARKNGKQKKQNTTLPKAKKRAIAYAV
jgi:hypothetical protein